MSLTKERLEAAWEHFDKHGFISGLDDEKHEEISETITEALKKLLDAKTVPTWQPIETAPKDGSWISCPFVGKIRWEKGLMMCEGAWTTTPKTNGTHVIVKPIYWLPTPPEKTS